MFQFKFIGGSANDLMRKPFMLMDYATVRNIRVHGQSWLSNFVSRLKAERDTSASYATSSPRSKDTYALPWRRRVSLNYDLKLR